MSLNRPRTVELVGRGQIRIDPSDHMATGGEASIYRKGTTVIKIYTDPTKMVQDGTVTKIRTLCGISQEYIVAPKGLVTDVNGQPIGLYMDYIDGEPLSRVFTNDFRQRERFGDREASLLVAHMFEVMRFAHGRNLILCDPNELNWTTVPAPKGRDPRIIDVDSWIVGGKMPKTVPMMASIRDWHTKGVNAATDQFALGVVTFQVYTGIHPYKGTLAGYKPSEMTRRMQDNASVFTPGVRLNAAVRDFNCIPGPLLGWYEAAFERSERSDPPSPFDTGITVAPRRVVTTRMAVTTAGTLKYQRLLDTSGDPAVRVFSCGVAMTRSGELFELSSGRHIGSAPGAQVEVVGAGGGWLVGWKDVRETRFSFIDNRSLAATELACPVRARNVVRSVNRLFAVTDDGLVELGIKVFAKPILVTDNTWRAMPNATKWFDGVGIQDAFGASFVFVPFGERSCAQVRVRELDELKVVAAKAGHRFVAIIGVDRDGEYRKVELTFDRLYQTYSAWQGGAESPELNMALLPRGVVATIVQDGELVVFVPTSADRGALTINRVADKDIATTMSLYSWDDAVVFIRDGQVWRLSMT